MKRAVIGLVFLLAGCGAVAAVTYRAKLKSCVDLADTRAEADTCIQKVQAAYDEAGAPPAAKLDGGVE